MARKILCLVALGMMVAGSACGPDSTSADASSPETPCTPACGERVCGDDGCGGSCGRCGLGLTCNTRDGTCETCIPACAGRECGDDGCGGECGTCGGKGRCDVAEGVCVVCNPACQDRKCGDDGCGGVCGTCPDGQTCNPLKGQCLETCTPDCEGRECGSDGCGGFCGYCADGQRCVESDASSGCEALADDVVEPIDADDLPDRRDAPDVRDLPAPRDAAGEVPDLPREVGEILDVAEVGEDVSPDVLADDGGELPGPPGEFGDPCRENGDCLSGLCMSTVSGRFCTQACVENCPEGYACQYVSISGRDPGYACVRPETSLCRPCTGDADCPVVPGEAARCLDYGANGRFCATSCASGQCPVAYTCIDDTAGGALSRLCVAETGDCPCLQEFAGLATSCHVSNGAGTCEGTRKCAQAGQSFAWEACTAGVPAEETCNGRDDNCNSAIDEGLGESVCGKGICAHVVPACEDGRPGQCDPYQGQAAESCNGLDDDCDGLTDEVWPGNGSACDGPDADQCTNGRWGCSEDGQSLVCQGDDVNQDEVCNGLDDDCDGDADEVEDLGQTECGVGRCRHTVANCLGGQPQNCNPLEGMQEDDLPDPDFQDSNCDGLDGDATRTIFVDATSGRDLNPGTIDLPKRTVQAGIDTAFAEGMSIVAVSIGTYNETVHLENGVGVYGQYDRASGWQRRSENLTQIKGKPAAAGQPQAAVFADDLSSPTDLHGFLIASESASIPGQSSYGIMARNSPGLAIVACTVQAGSGAPGTMGTMGVQGLNGDSGSGGLGGCEYDTTCSFNICNKCDRPLGGRGGPSPCGNTGGSGGNGGSSEGNGSDGSTGSGTGGGYGGTGGMTEGNGYPGGPGTAGQNGRNGTGGTEGVLAADGYLPGSGLKGIDGVNGSGGGGGGGGGGDSPGLCECKSYGGAGGGGGGGGCGGSGGVGGGGGGASIGIYVYGADILVSRTVIKTGGGGSGGMGGYGAAGGQGGTAGPGGPAETDSAAGAAGGRGGKGGNGGHGGGGAGGPSAGVVCAGGLVSLDQVSFVLGLPGEGGQSAGEAGMAGIRADELGCGP